MSLYTMTREEFRAELEELLIQTRPDLPINSHDITYHIEKLEEVIFGVRGVNDAPPEVFSQYLGSL